MGGGRARDVRHGCGVRVLRLGRRVGQLAGAGQYLEPQAIVMNEKDPSRLIVDQQRKLVDPV